MSTWFTPIHRPVSLPSRFIWGFCSLCAVQGMIVMFVFLNVVKLSYCSSVCLDFARLYGVGWSWCGLLAKAIVHFTPPL